MRLMRCDAWFLDRSALVVIRSPFASRYTPIVFCQRARDSSPAPEYFPPHCSRRAWMRSFWAFVRWTPSCGMSAAVVFLAGEDAVFVAAWGWWVVVPIAAVAFAVAVVFAADGAPAFGPWSSFCAGGVYPGGSAWFIGGVYSTSPDSFVTAPSSSGV